MFSRKHCYNRNCQWADSHDWSYYAKQQSILGARPRAVSHANQSGLWTLTPICRLLNSQSVIRNYFFVDSRNRGSSIGFKGCCIVAVDRCIDLDGYEKRSLQQTNTSINHIDGVTQRLLSGISLRTRRTMASVTDPCSPSKTL
jgi:hypothetical protein